MISIIYDYVSVCGARVFFYPNYNKLSLSFLSFPIVVISFYPSDKL